MGEILGLGMTHTPPLLSALGDRARRIKSMLADPLLPEQYRDPARWPEPMQREWGDDEGQTHAQRHRDTLIECMQWSRQELDAFKPDLVVIFGDDQYENFKEDCVPAFQVNCYDSVVAKPWAHVRPDRATNPWNEPPEKEFFYKGDRRAAKHLASRLIEAGFEVAYAYEARHAAMPHAILNTALFLDWDRRGFDYPVIAFLTNCYGRALVPLKGGGVHNLAQIPQEDDLDPPSPMPWRCFDLGRALARILTSSPWRVALVASSSWSHAFLASGTSYFHNAVEADRRYYDAMVAGDYDFWRKTSLQEIETNGHQEMLNWMLMLGAMAELGGRKPQEARWVESWITNANKVFAVFRP
jgi:hypothetical protein